MTQSFERSFYENDAYWEVDRYPQIEHERCLSTLSWIPNDLSSILDLGCGNGIITNQITIPGLVVGADRSFSALQHVLTGRSQLRAENLPFRNQSFDMVISAEMIEHIPFPEYANVLREISRVAKRYILITVPFCEDRKVLKYSCPYCGCTFHVQNHMRSYCRSDMTELFSFDPTLRVAKLQGIVQTKTPWFRTQLHAIRKSIFGYKSRLPWYALCPQCGYKESNDQFLPKNLAKENRARKLFRKLFPHRNTFTWWQVLFERSW